MDADHSTVEYRDIPGFPGYRVGDDGSVWNAWINCRWGRRLTDRWKRMRTPPNEKGYLRVNLTPPSGGQFQTFRLHRLVLEAFVGPCPLGMECRHLNGDKSDCCLTNLCWGTQEDNRQDNRDLDAYQRGEEHSQAVLDAEKVRLIRARHAAGEAPRVLAEDNGVTLSNVYAIINRKSWKHVD
jgi:hypothetical protein